MAGSLTLVLQQMSAKSDISIKKTDLPLQNPVVWMAVWSGGCAGTLLRFYWGAFFPAFESDLPWEVLTENITGAFLLGAMLSVLTRKLGKHRYLRAFWGTGLIGSFTTFSGITVDLAAYSRAGDVVPLIIYALMSIILGLISAWMGWKLATELKKLLVKQKCTKNTL